ncbi:MAG: hypothetical protein JNJ83_06900 [Verrucomicrobiaceae bacterium]|nr:hypothetical protein [Verrucomicrobiaceae bacterium]
MRIGLARSSPRLMNAAAFTLAGKPLAFLSHSVRLISGQHTTPSSTSRAARPTSLRWLDRSHKVSPQKRSQPVLHYCYNCLTKKVGQTSSCPKCGRVPKTPRQLQLSTELSKQNWSPEQTGAFAQAIGDRRYEGLPKRIAVFAAAVAEEDDMRVKRVHAANEALAEDREWAANYHTRRRTPSMMYGCFFGPLVIFFGASFLYIGSQKDGGGASIILGLGMLLIGLTFAHHSYTKFVQLWSRTTPDKSTSSDWFVSSIVIAIKKRLNKSDT